MSEPEKESIQPPLFREADLLDGRGDEADRAEEGQRRLQVFSAIGAYLSRKTRHGRRHHAAD